MQQQDLQGRSSDLQGFSLDLQRATTIALQGYSIDLQGYSKSIVLIAALTTSYAPLITCCIMGYKKQANGKGVPGMTPYCPFWADVAPLRVTHRSLSTSSPVLGSCDDSNQASKHVT